MPLQDRDIVRRRNSSSVPSNQVDFILYAYGEEFFAERTFRSVDDLVRVIEQESKSPQRFFWIDVINRSGVDLPDGIRLLCEHFDIHPLTMEDIGTLAPYMKLDLFTDQAALYLLMKDITWNGQRIEQQQLSFYLKCSKNLLITFRESCYSTDRSLFHPIRHRLRREPASGDQHCRLRQLNVDYLLYCLLDDLVDRYMTVMEEISNRIGHFDRELMADRQARNMLTLHSIYLLKHDLLHVRILSNPLKEIINRLKRTTVDENNVAFPRGSSPLRLVVKHHVLRRQARGGTVHEDSSPIVSSVALRYSTRRKSQVHSIYLNEYIYVYLNDLNNQIDHLLDALEIQGESVRFLISFWITLNSNETQEILQFLMLMSVLFMPCILLTGLNSTNFNVQPQYEYVYGYYIVLGLLAAMLVGMLVWYKVKRWI